MKTPLGKLLEQIENNDLGINAALITNPENVEHYSGFTGNGAMLFVHSLARYLIITDSAGPGQCLRQNTGFKVLSIPWSEAVKMLSELCNKLGIHGIWFEEKHIAVGNYELLKDALRDVQLVPFEGMLTHDNYDNNL